MHKDAIMRTTIDISEPLLRKAKSKAALDGKKLKDIVNEALEELLVSESRFSESKRGLPANARLDEVGKFRIPVLQSRSPGKKRVSAKLLKYLESNDDASRYGSSD